MNKERKTEKQKIMKEKEKQQQQQQKLLSTHSEHCARGANFVYIETNWNEKWNENEWKWMKKKT